MDRKKLRELGIERRKAVLGAEYVDKSIASADELYKPFLDTLHETCWGAIWGDDRISPREHSLVNLGMIAALNRMHEWEIHLRGALRNGVTKDEIAAVINQITVYAGMPCGVECMRIARKVFDELEAQ